ncbi:serine acetyltransferase, partial [Dehalococcoides mccartyi]
CTACGTWVALRARLATGRLIRQGIEEIALGILVSAMMVVGLFLPAHYLLRWDAIWLNSTFSSALFVLSLGGMTGPGYVFLRISARVWLFWESLRRRRMLWALTHAHLTVVVVAVILGTGLLFVFSLFGGKVVLAEQQKLMDRLAQLEKNSGLKVPQDELRGQIREIMKEFNL